MKVEVIVPSKPLFNIALFEQRAREQMRRQAEETRAQFEKTTATWKHQIVFTVEGDMHETRVGTNSDLYAGVDQGTPAHIITPKNARFLRFTVPFTPKTRSGVIGSGSGSRGDTLIKASSVQHPGTKPRRFAEAIQRRLERKLYERMLDALKSAVGG